MFAVGEAAVCGAHCALIVSSAQPVPRLVDLMFKELEQGVRRICCSLPRKTQLLCKERCNSAPSTFIICPRCAITDLYSGNLGGIHAACILYCTPSSFQSS